MDEMITKAQYDSDMARHERNFKRLWILAIILIISLVGSNIGWMVYESQFSRTVTETYTAETDSGGTAIANGKGSVTLDGESDIHEDNPAR